MLNLIQPGRLEEQRAELPMSVSATQSGSFDSPRNGTFVSAGAAVQVPPFPLVSEALTAGCIPGGPRAATENVRNAISLLLRVGGYCREPRDTTDSYFNREHGMELETAALTQRHSCTAGTASSVQTGLDRGWKTLLLTPARETSGSLNPRSCLGFCSAIPEQRMRRQSEQRDQGTELLGMPTPGAPEPSHSSSC